MTKQDEVLLAVVRPYLADVGSEGDVAYRLWRRGLEVALAEVVSLGAALPPGTTEDLIASLVAQRLLLCVPLLRRTGKLALLGIAPSSWAAQVTTSAVSLITDTGGEAIDESASNAIAGLGGSDFL